MRVVSVSHGKHSASKNIETEFKNNHKCSHIKGKASHKIVSDGM
jgi:hypothetical protein